jgi:Tfp pilus assembly protein PilZ
MSWSAEMLSLDGSQSVASKQHQNGEKSVEEPETGSEEVASLSVIHKTREEFQEVFARELLNGAVFVPTLDCLPAGRRARITVDLLFCAARLELEGEVVASLAAPIAGPGTAPGISIQLSESPVELRKRIEQLSGIQPLETDSQPAPFSRMEPRFPASASVLLEVDGRRLSAETGDVSYNGMLALLHGVDLGVDTELRVWIEHPRTGEKLELEARIVNQTRCDNGVMAVGMQFVYELERIDEVARFVDDLRSFHHARNLATISGSLEDTPLEVVLETFASASDAGTLRLIRGDEEGKIAYQEREIVYATAGLVSSAKALGRLFTWVDAQFEFRPEVEPMDGARGRMPLTPAILAAAVARDELARLDLSKLILDTVFTVDSDRLDAVAPTIDELGQKIAEDAQMGFPLGTMLDMIPNTDADIYKTVTELIEAGILHIESC